MRVDVVFLRWVLLLVVVWPSLVAADEPLQLLVISSQRDNGQLALAAPARAMCVFGELQVPIVLRSSQWLSARRLVQSGEVDGLFPAPVQGQRDTGIVASAPLLLERWVWWQRRAGGAAEPGTLPRTGALPGGPVADFLAAHEVQVAVTADSIGQLLRLLAAGRIDRFLADRGETVSQARLLQLDLSQFDSRLERYVPLGVWLRQEVVAAIPDFNRRFLRAVASCQDESLLLEPPEQDMLRALVRQALVPWSEDRQLRALLREVQVPSRRQREIDRLEAQYSEEEGLEAQPMRRHLQESAVSRRLGQLAQSHAAVVAELFVTDRDGITVGALAPTSDIWQGDEDKFLQTITQDPPFIEPLRYDPSSQRFVVHASVKVIGEGRLLGVLTLGFDVAALMHGQPAL